VFAFVEWAIERGSVRITPRRAFFFGAALVFLMLTSSVHLVTLLPGLGVYAAWRLGVFRKSGPATAFIGGGILCVATLAAIYALTTNSVAIFDSSGHAQFHDVVSSIPILRPLSRSVQVANLLIRSKQFIAEAPAALLVVPVVALALWRTRGRSDARGITLAFAIVFLSWVLLEGAEVHYLMHIVPLMLLVTIVLLSRTSNYEGQWPALIAIVIAGALTVLSVRDANSAFVEGSRIARSNDRATGGLFAAIASDWQRPGLPIVLVEPPALEGLMKYPLRLTTDHFLSFPQYALPLDRYLDTLAIDYIVLYNSPDYPKVRPSSDPLYQTVRSHAILVDLETGTIGDIGRTYFEPSTFRDTLLLFRWRR
jgi:hypothetical protein